MKGYDEPWGNPAPYPSGPQEPVPGGPEIAEDKGSVPLGILGAALGALVGAIPWFLVSAFANFYVGWLGFLIGWAAAFGYQKLKGRKSFGLAIAVVVISSLLALVAAEFGSVMYLLCTDSNVKYLAYWSGEPVIKVAFETMRLLLPEIFEEILPNLAIGLLIGGLGILSAGKYVRQYTDPEMAAEIAQRVQMAHNPLNSFQSPGLELPRQFTVGMSKGRKTAVAILAAFVFVLVAFLLLLGAGMALDGDSETLMVGLVLAVVLGGVMVFAMLAVQRHIDVDGDYLLVKGQTFGAWDIANVSMSQLNGAIKLYGHDNRVLAQFGSNMNNAPLMIQWLREHNIPLRG